VGYCKNVLSLIFLTSDHKHWLKLCIELLNNLYNVFASVLTFDTGLIGNYCKWCTGIYIFSILMTSAVSPVGVCSQRDRPARPGHAEEDQGT